MSYLGIPPGMVYSDIWGWHWPGEQCKGKTVPEIIHLFEYIFPRPERTPTSAVARPVLNDGRSGPQNPEQPGIPVSFHSQPDEGNLE